MADTELATLELCARGAMTDSWYTKTTSADDATAAYIAAANPAAILELIAELLDAIVYLAAAVILMREKRHD